MEKKFVIDESCDDMIELTYCIYSIREENGLKFLYVIGKLIGQVTHEYTSYDALLDKKTTYIFITRTF